MAEDFSRLVRQPALSLHGSIRGWAIILGIPRLKPTRAIEISISLGRTGESVAMPLTSFRHFRLPSSGSIFSCLRCLRCLIKCLSVDWIIDFGESSNAVHHLRAKREHSRNRRQTAIQSLNHQRLVATQPLANHSLTMRIALDQKWRRIELQN